MCEKLHLEHLFRKHHKSIFRLEAVTVVNKQIIRHYINEKYTIYAPKIL